MILIYQEPSRKSPTYATRRTDKHGIEVVKSSTDDRETTLLLSEQQASRQGLDGHIGLISAVREGL